MSKQREFVKPDQFAGPGETEGAAPESVVTEKKSFVEPEISASVDVLEATTFFQSATSGVSNP